MSFTPTGSGEVKRITIYTAGQSKHSFMQTGSGTAFFKGVNGNSGVIERTTLGSPAHEVYKYYTRSGLTYWFFGDDISGAVVNPTTSTTATTQLIGQLWKITYDNGKTPSEQPTMYVGDTLTSNPTVNDAYRGFKLCTGTPNIVMPHVVTMFDSAGRKYTYTYNSDYEMITTTVIDSATNATLSSTTLHYRSSDTTDIGLAKSLQAIQTTEYVQPAVSGGPTVDRIQYFRYYTSTIDGRKDRMRMVIDPEGVRKYCIDNSVAFPGSAISTLEGISVSSENTLKPYSSSFIDEYYDSTNSSSATWKYGRVKKMTVQGKCGCGSSSGASSIYEIDYEQNVDSSNAQVAPDTDGTYNSVDTWWIGTSTDRPKWRLRTTVKQPDNTYTVTYFDDTAQVLANMTCALNPATSSGSGQTYWATVYQRVSRTRVTRVFSPETVASYDHSLGSFTFDWSKGTVQRYQYASTTSTTSDEKYLSGSIVKQVEVNDGTSSNLFYVQSVTEFETTVTSGTGTWFRDIGTGSASDKVRLSVPVVTSQIVYKNAILGTDTTGLATASNYDKTSFSYLFWDGPWTPKRIVTTQPVVSTANNGSGTAVTTTTWIDQRSGKPSFSSDADGVLTFTEYNTDTWQVVRRVDDPDSSVSGVTAAADSFGSSDKPVVPASSTAYFKNVTSYEYDLNGRLRYATAPNNRKSFMHYTRLADHQMVTLSGP